jgi:hypothetical protein
MLDFPVSLVIEGFHMTDFPIMKVLRLRFTRSILI